MSAGDGDGAAKQQPPYRVCIVGCGAIGMHIAARLVLGGKASVTAVARGDALEALRAGGTLHAKSGGGPQRFALDRVCASPGEVGEVDAVVVAVKATQLPALAGTLAALLRDAAADLPVFFATNGIPWYYFHECGGDREGERLPLLDPGNALWEAVGPRRAVHVTVRTACQVLRPGEVQVNSPTNLFTLCEPSGDEASPRAHRLADALAAGGVQAVVKGDMRHEVWFKLLGNISFNPVSMLTGSSLAGMAADGELREALLKPMIQEATAVAAALGVDTSQFPAPDQRIDLVRAMTHPTSMLQDYRAARPMEIDALLGQVQAFARSLGVKTPMLEAVVALARTAERLNAKRPAEAAESGRGERKAPRPSADDEEAPR